MAICDRVYKKQGDDIKAYITKRDGDPKAKHQTKIFFEYGTGDLVLQGAGYDSDKYGSSSPFRCFERQVLDDKWRLTASARTTRYRA